MEAAFNNVLILPDVLANVVLIEAKLLFMLNL